MTSLPYRPCVGIMLLNKDGKVWIAGSAKGTVEGPGDWRRAAIVYYFDFF